MSTTPATCSKSVTEKLRANGVKRNVALRCADLNSGVEMADASLALMVLTLQFLRPLHREKLIADIFAGLRENGGLILVEKVLGEDSHFNRLFIKHYYDTSGATATRKPRLRRSAKPWRTS